MRLTYIIGVKPISSGLGGHHRSLGALVECMMRHGHPCHIVTITRTIDSPVLRDLSCPQDIVSFAPHRPLRFLRTLRRAVSASAPDVVHCFDLESFFHSFNAGIPHRYPAVFSKCGGPTYRRAHPVPNDVVLFSAEDLRWFQGRPQYAATRFHHIPNRVAPVPGDPGKCAEIRALAGGRKTILRVCRIGAAHEQSIRAGAELVGRLRRAGLEVVLVVVGAIERPEIFQRLVCDLGDSVVFLTEERYCRQGAALLEAGDLVYGTGRGFMEGACLGRPLLAPVANSRCPVLATEADFDRLLQCNFSARAVVSPLDEEANLRDIVLCLTDRSVWENKSAESLDWYRRFFSIEAAYERYFAVYRGARPMAYRLSQQVHCLACAAYLHLLQGIRLGRSPGARAREALV